MKTSKTAFIVSREYSPGIFSNEPRVPEGCRVQQSGNKYEVKDPYGRLLFHINRDQFKKLSKTAIRDESGMTLAREVGQEIRRAREVKEMTLEVLAGQLGATRQYMSDVERGTKTVSLNQLEKIAAILNVELRVRLVRRYTGNQCLNNEKEVAIETR